MALLNQGQWPAVVQKDLSLIFLDQFRDIPSMAPLIYRYKKAEQGVERDLETGDIGVVPVFDGEVSYEDVRQGYTKDVSETEYALGLKVTRRLLRNDLYGVVQDRTRLLAQAFRHLRETRAAFPFVNAFNTGFTVGDGLQLCSTAHTSRFGGATQSNRATNAFSAPNLQTNVIRMKKFTTNRDNPMVNIPDTIIIPMDLEETAYHINKSAGQVNTANNNRNYQEGRYKVIVWDNYLTDVDNWFIANSMMMKQKLIFREWDPVQFFRSGEFNTLVSLYAGYCSFEVSSVEWRWVLGSEV